jgi:molybdenum cofactor cytidylyltransferase
MPKSASEPEHARHAPNGSLRFGVIILAAGASSRLGTPKQLVLVGGKPLLARMVEAALASEAWPVIVVLGANAEQVRPTLARLPVLAVDNAAWAEGMASSVRTGIAALQQFSRAMDAALIALCDQPAFSPEVIARLVAEHRNSRRGIVAARYGNRQGAPALFAREHFTTLAALTGEEGARELLNGDPAHVAAVDLPELAFDIDTPADVAALTASGQPHPNVAS